jgi:hypothetical protein
MIQSASTTNQAIYWEHLSLCREFGIFRWWRGGEAGTKKEGNKDIDNGIGHMFEKGSRCAFFHHLKLLGEESNLNTSVMLGSTLH